jgi:PRTRC genetic system ThiF family protein
MNTFPIDASRRGQVQLAPTKDVWVYLVGTGGTGSYLAQSLARLAWHARTKGIQVNLTFIDPDRVAQKNVGRQLFCPAEVGMYKAETLALRFNAALGLAIRAVPNAVQALSFNPPTNTPDRVLVMGAVDNHLARQALSELAHKYRVWWCDGGNEAMAGRVFIGNFTARDMHGNRGLDAFGWCRGLPLPSLQDPDLLHPEPTPPPTALSCADLTARDEQSLMVNQMMASVMAQYATDFVLYRRLTTYRTIISLDPPTVVSNLITEASLAVLYAIGLNSR